MVIDSSAIVAMVFEEPEGERFMELALASHRTLVGAVSKLEADIVVRSRKGTTGARRLAKFYDEIAITFADFSSADATVAFDAWRRYGKGNHPAALNMGDCCTYALCKRSGEPLLCKGADFAKTDLKIVSA